MKILHLFSPLATPTEKDDGKRRAESAERDKDKGREFTLDYFFLFFSLTA